MTNILIKDGTSATKYVAAQGAGTNGDPNIPIHTINNNYSILALHYADPTAGGLSDVTDDNFAAIAAGDFEIRSTGPQVFVIPMAARGWRSLTLNYYIDTTYNANLTLYVDSVFRDAGLTGNFRFGARLAIVVPPISGGDHMAIAANEPSAIGGIQGANPAANLATLTIPNLNDGWPYISLMFIAASSPSAGRFSLGIARLGA
jgi:hypothetical protein